MTEQQMPTRIWVNPIAIVSPDIYFPNAVMTNGNENIKSGDVSFIRADIAERMAEALEGLVANIEDYERINNLSPSPGKIDCWQSVTHAKAALSAFRSATQDTEAVKHD